MHENLIHFDHARLRQAIVLLLDKRYGESRTKRLRALFRTANTKRVKMKGTLEPLNELISVFNAKALVALDILDKAERKRKEFAKMEETDHPVSANRRKCVRTCMERARVRVNTVARIETLELGRDITEAELRAALKKYRAKWSAYRKQRLLERKPDENYRELSTKIADEIDEELNSKLAFAINNPGIRAVSSHMEREATKRALLDEKKLRRLTAKFK